MQNVDFPQKVIIANQAGNNKNNSFKGSKPSGCKEKRIGKTEYEESDQ